MYNIDTNTGKEMIVGSKEDIGRDSAQTSSAQISGSCCIPVKGTDVKAPNNLNGRFLQNIPLPK